MPNIGDVRPKACPECSQAGRDGGDLVWVATSTEPWLQGIGVALGEPIPQGRAGKLWRCANENCTWTEGFVANA